MNIIDKQIKTLNSSFQTNKRNKNIKTLNFLLSNNYYLSLIIFLIVSVP